MGEAHEFANGKLEFEEPVRHTFSDIESRIYRSEIWNQISGWRNRDCQHILANEEWDYKRSQREKRSVSRRTTVFKAFEQEKYS